MVMMNYNSYIYGRWVKWGAIVLVTLILVIGSISTYNGLITADQEVQKEWSLVESQMQRRADVISNQVEVVKGYVKHEEKVFEDIAAARSVLFDNYSDINSKIAADEQMKESGKSMLALVEGYPELKASKLFENLQTDIEGSENRVAVARRNFIEKVQVYNTKLARFPGNLFAKALGFEKIEYYKASPGAQESPKVDFGS